MELSNSHKRKVEYLRKQLEELILSADQRILETHPIAAYVKKLDANEGFYGYHFVPSMVRSQRQEMSDRFGSYVLELYHRLLLVALIGTFDERKNQYRIPESIQALILQEFERILTAMESSDDGFYTHENELFVKDLSLCRLKLLPCGSELIDLNCGVPRKTLLGGGIFQFVQASVFLTMRLGGFKPFYESHWDRRLVRKFTIREYDLCYVRIAELLEMNPHVKGMFSSSWWFDPILRIISPELLFLRRIPEENGAKVFRIGTDASTVRDAVRLSKKRRGLYEAGNYRPCRYMLVWGRDDILKYAKRIVCSGKLVLNEKV